MAAGEPTPTTGATRHATTGDANPAGSLLVDTDPQPTPPGRLVSVIHDRTLALTPVYAGARIAEVVRLDVDVRLSAPGGGRHLLALSTVAEHAGRGVYIRHRPTGGYSSFLYFQRLLLADQTNPRAPLQAHWKRSHDSNASDLPTWNARERDHLKHHHRECDIRHTRTPGATRNGDISLLLSHSLSSSIAGMCRNRVGSMTSTKDGLHRPLKQDECRVDLNGHDRRALHARLAL